jgi:hypothetical protein
MKKRFLSLFIFIASVLTGGFLLAANVSALPTLPAEPTTPTAPTETPTPTTPTTPTPETPTTPETPETPAETNPETPAEGEETVNNCSDQMGKMSWAICPITGVIATATDTAMGALEGLLVVNMQSDVFDSPLYYIWEYIRNIANILFVIFFLVIIFSHFTQWNITTYALRRVAPKLLIVAILINLSFYISVAAVNISDIFGVSLVGLFDSIAEGAAASGAMNLADIPTWEALVAGAIGGTAIGAGAIAGLALAGGLTGLFFVLLPVLLGAVVAVIAALFTMAARQALIFLLVMLSPLAFASILLSGTENLFNLWKKYFLQMLVIFPMFALLYGASRLAGWAIIATADGMLQVVLGMAVQVVPLVMTPALLRMSGSVLGKVNELVRKPFAPAQGALSRYSQEKQAIARARMVNAGMRGSYNPSAKLAAFLEKQKALRGESLALESKIATYRIGSYVDNYVSAHSLKNGNQELKHKIGYTAKQAGVDELNANIANLNRSSALNEASGWSDAEHPAKTYGQRKMARIAAKGTQAWMELWTAEQRKLENDFGDEQYRNERLDAAYKAYERVQMGGKNRHFRLRDGDAEKLADYDSFITPIEGTVHRTSLNPGTEAQLIAEGKIMRDRSVARAMTMRNMMNKKTRDAYATLFDDTDKTYSIQYALKQSFKEQDFEKMEAAMAVMGKRGDWNLIQDEIRIATENGALGEVDSRANKRLMDALIGVKADHMGLATYAKSMNIRRGKYGNFEGAINELLTANTTWTREQAIDAHWSSKINDYDIDRYLNELKAIDEHDATTREQALAQLVQKKKDAYAKDTMPVGLVDWAKDRGNLGMLKMLGDISNPAIAKTQDRTYWESLTDLMWRANIKPDAGQVGNLIKQIRSAACSGEIDGETLTNMTNHLLYSMEGYDEDETKSTKRKVLNRESIAAYFKDMSASQLKGMKAGQLSMVNDALLDQKDAFKNGVVSPELRIYLARAIYQIANGNGMLMSEMNTDIAAKLHIEDFSERGSKFGESKLFTDMWGAPTGDSDIPTIHNLEPELLDVFARTASPAEITKLGSDSDLVRKLVDYRLTGKGGSYGTGAIDKETQAMFDRLSGVSKDMLDPDVRDKLGYNNKKPSL